MALCIEERHPALLHLNYEVRGLVYHGIPLGARAHFHLLGRGDHDLRLLFRSLILSLDNMHCARCIKGYILSIRNAPYRQ